MLAGVLLAATPLASDGFVPFVTPASPAGARIDQATGVGVAPADTFDPVARAALLARDMPRLWRGTYQGFPYGAVLPVELSLTTVKAMGGMVDLRGQITIDGVATPVQGNLDAESDQLDLLPLGDQLGGGLQPGGVFQGLEGLELSGWTANRLTDQGGRLALKPAVSGDGKGAVPVRGLW